MVPCSGADGDCCHRRSHINNAADRFSSISEAISSTHAKVPRTSSPSTSSASQAGQLWLKQTTLTEGCRIPRRSCGYLCWHCVVAAVQVAPILCIRPRYVQQSHGSAARHANLSCNRVIFKLAERMSLPCDIVVDLGDDSRLPEQLDEHDVRAVSCERGRGRRDI
jgi:hypothetical protein